MLARHRPEGRAAAHGGIVYAVATAKNKSAPLYEQTKDALAQIDSTLAEAGSNKSRIVRVTVYITDMSRKPEMDCAWEGGLGKSTSARLHRRHIGGQGPGRNLGHRGTMIRVRFGPKSEEIGVVRACPFVPHNLTKWMVQDMLRASN